MVLLSTPLQYITSTPPATRGITIATALFSALYFWLTWAAIPTIIPISSLILIPGLSFIYPWTFITSGLVETTVIELICTLLFVPASLRYFEKLWGSVELIKFVLAVLGGSNLLAFGFNWLEYIFTRNADLFLYDMDYHGQMSLIAAILVAFTQIIPEHRVQVFGVFKAKVKSFPMAYVGLCNVMVLIGYQAPWINIQWGFFVGWAYLRFYKKNKIDAGASDSYGDRSETFAFVYWFPPFLHYPVSFICNTAYALCSKLHLIPSAGPDLESGAYAQVPGGPRAEAERRRTLALKALDQRMAAAAAPPPSVSAPSQSSRQPAAVPEASNSNSAKGRRKSVGEVDIANSSESKNGKSSPEVDDA